MTYQKGLYAKGFTLIELMISLTIGSIVAFTSLTLYTQISKSTALVRTESVLQENAYFIQQTIRQYINQAGYRPLQSNPPAAPILPIRNIDRSFPAVPDKWQSGEYIRSVDNGLAIRFEGASLSDGTADGSVINCQREAIAESETVELQFTVSNGTLICSSAGEDIKFVGTEDGFVIEQAVFAFGIDTNNDKSVDQFQDASIAVADSEDLLAVRIDFLLRSVDAVLSHNNEYYFNGTASTATDKKLRQESSTIVKLKN